MKLKALTLSFFQLFHTTAQVVVEGAVISADAGLILKRISILMKGITTGMLNDFDQKVWQINLQNQIVCTQKL